MKWKVKEEHTGKSLRNRPLESFKKHHIEVLLEDIRNLYFEEIVAKPKKKKDVDTEGGL
jgi:hypothetical protein